MSVPKDFEPQRQEEQVRKERYGLGDRISLFRLIPQVNDPKDIVRTYSSSFTLTTPETPDLSFVVTLGFPKGRYPSMRMLENKKLTVEADLRTHAISKSSNAGAAVLPITFYYTLNPQLTEVLGRLRMRVYDGEDGKVYEASPSERGLREGGTLTFESDFHEIELDENGKMVSQREQASGLAYTLSANTGAENTVAEFLLLPK